MEKEQIERLAKERAEKMAMHEVMANNVVVWFPLAFIALVMILGGAPSWLSVLFFTFAFVAGVIGGMMTWDNAYKKYYMKSLEELKALSLKSDKNEK